jgi:predicted metal-dependent enzyme (double-stranded beta helix superfamily)
MATSARAAAVAETVTRVRRIERELGVTRAALERIKAEMIGLASRTDLFPAVHFPVPAGKHGQVYRLAEDADFRFALYASAGMPGKAQPPHNHTTWAVIVGVSGEELNRFYDRAGGGVREKGQSVVKQGTGVCFLPEDLHSIHIQAPLVNFHMYGLALDHLHKREYYKAEEKTWKVFPAHGDIREAR